MAFSSLCMPQTGALMHFHGGKALVNKPYSSVQTLGGMDHFMGTSSFQFVPSVHWANYKFSHKHIVDPYHKMLAGSDLYQCVQYVLYSVHCAAVTFTDCSRLKWGKTVIFLSVYGDVCHVLYDHTQIQIWGTVWKTELKKEMPLILPWKHTRPK